MCFIIRDLCNTTQQFDFSYKFSLLSETIMFYGWHLVCGNVSLEAYDLLCGMREGASSYISSGGMCVDTRD